ncbi:MAG: TIGR03545 family protein [Oligoflexia bacterium]|nr:TIGR03545 family protein [Oligoflexia bacterium]
MVKTKGPFRTGAILPVCILLLLIFAYFRWYFDAHIRWTLEYVASRVHGAEVNIASFRSNFLKPSIQVDRIEVTDKEKPEQNLFSVDEFQISLEWAALLRAKLSSDKAYLLGIRYHSARKKPGKVFPPEPEGNSLVAQAKREIVSQTKEKFKESFLGDLAAIIDGVNPKDQLQAIKEELQSAIKIDQLTIELKEKEAAWKKRIEELPRPKELKEIEAEIKALDLKSKDPKSIAANIGEAKKIIDKINDKLKKVKETKNSFTTEMGETQKQILEIEKMVQQDVQSLQNKFSLPSINPSEISTQFFMQQVEGRLVELRKYEKIAKKVMPPKKTAEQKAKEKEEAIVPRERSGGLTVSYPITSGYPLFWFKDIQVSSEFNEKDGGGRIAGAIRNLSSSPSLVNLPMEITLDGDFPAKEVMGFSFVGKIDNRTANEIKQIQLSVKSFPIEKMTLSKSEKASLAVLNSKSSAVIFAQQIGEQINIKMENTIRSPKFDLKTSNQKVQEVIGQVLNSMDLLTVSSSVSGRWDDLKISIQSNIGSAIANSFSSVVGGKIAEERKKIESMVNEKIGSKKKDLSLLAGGIEKQVGGEITNADSMLTGLLDQAKAKSAGGSSIPDAGKKLLKGFGF